MGQLIKLQDYISRYEIDHLRYPAQFMRLKKQQWLLLKEAWKNGEHLHKEDPETAKEEQWGLIKKFKSILKKEKLESGLEDQSKDKAEEFNFTFSPLLHYLPETEEELKKIFLDQFFSFQIKWASSTIWDQSFVDSRYYRDDKLKYLLQRFPDTFLVFYQPVFMVKKAPVEMNVLLVTPTDIWCLVFIEEEKDEVYIGSTEHFWVKRSSRAERKILNPVIDLNRMAKIIKPILTENDVELPVRMGIICREGYIDFPDAPYDLALIDKRRYPDWFRQQRGLHSPIKHMQLKAVKALLDNCQTSYVPRSPVEQEIMDKSE
ncbi:NERD domain-containing protein [Heyndrickxia acidicola]|uniref:NERD domain-containing protein n=1 Tax=Heyndrickxia acidicola TaxID=209389 RepID=A0ABU6MGL0_9BACI|nr:NERD domain-containing protein [Heyndrickxia acidicola]MED1203151.1 NERD domain-containing protein [Heyndrickxia acidicola]